MFLLLGPANLLSFQVVFFFCLFLLSLQNVFAFPPLIWSRVGLYYKVLPLIIHGPKPPLFALCPPTLVGTRRSELRQSLSAAFFFVFMCPAVVPSLPPYPSCGDKLMFFRVFACTLTLSAALLSGIPKMPPQTLQPASPPHSPGQ